MCSSVTVCTSEGSPHRRPSIGCPIEFGASNCALHRQQDFQYGVVSPGLATLIPARNDLPPVTLRGFAVHGHPLLSSKQVTDLASCSRLCARTPDCRIVSFSQHSTGHKSCRLYHNMTTNELRVQGHSTVRPRYLDLTGCHAETLIYICNVNCGRGFIAGCFHDGNVWTVLYE